MDGGRGAIGGQSAIADIGAGRSFVYEWGVARIINELANFGINT